MQDVGHLQEILGSLTSPPLFFLDGCLIMDLMAEGLFNAYFLAKFLLHKKLIKMCHQDSVKHAIKRHANY